MRSTQTGRTDTPGAAGGQPNKSLQRKVAWSPVILTVNEVASLVLAPANLKHRTILATAYGTGARVSELAHLRVQDIDSQRMIASIRQGKGRKDREIPLAPPLLELLRTYWRKYRPSGWLFPGGRPIKKIGPAPRSDADSPGLGAPHSGL